MLAALRSACVLGIDAITITVEVNISQGLPVWTIVGLADSVVKEARERVVVALRQSGFATPSVRVLAALSPADIKKSGNAFDLPLALGFLVATRQLSAACVANLVVAGELGLDGSLRAIRGALPIARLVSGMRHAPDLLVPPDNVAEAALVTSLRVVTAMSLAELVYALERGRLTRAAVDETAPPAPSDVPDFAEVVGQPIAKRALLIAAAGGHNVAMTGPPGTGKTMLARRLAGILPLLTDEQHLDVVAIHSVAGTLSNEQLYQRRPPFRSPHHTISTAGLIGGGSIPKPGEISLASSGVLFLDELPELNLGALESLRQPLEDRVVTIARVAGSVRFPSSFQLIVAMNPCPCGYAGHPTIACQCDDRTIARYRRRVSGPLTDRIDLHVTVGAVPVADLAATPKPAESAGLRVRVAAARARQLARFETLNATVPPRRLADAGSVLPEAIALLRAASEQIGLSARAWHRTLKVGRTIADLAGEDAVSAASIAEALRYRPSPLPTSRAPITVGSHAGPQPLGTVRAAM